MATFANCIQDHYCWNPGFFVLVELHTPGLYFARSYSTLLYSWLDCMNYTAIYLFTSPFSFSFFFLGGLNLIIHTLAKVLYCGLFDAMELLGGRVIDFFFKYVITAKKTIRLAR